MTRAVRQRLIGLGAVLALLALAFWQWRADQQAAIGTLLAVSPPTIAHIAIAFGNGPTTHYARRDGHWWQTDGTAARADDGRLGELAAVAAAPVASWRAASEFQPDAIGLAPPQVVLQLDGQTLEFGAIAAIGPLRYVRVGPRVALIPARYTPRPITGLARQAGSRQASP